MVLASTSAARLGVLRAAGVEAEAVASGVDESAVSAGTPAELAGLLAELGVSVTALWAPRG